METNVHFHKGQRLIFAKKKVSKLHYELLSDLFQDKEIIEAFAIAYIKPNFFSLNSKLYLFLFLSNNTNYELINNLVEDYYNKTKEEVFLVNISQEVDKNEILAFLAILNRANISILDIK